MSLVQSLYLIFCEIKGYLEPKVFNKLKVQSFKIFKVRDKLFNTFLIR